MKLFDVYPLYDVTPVKAKDVFVYDENGTEYLDLMEDMLLFLLDTDIHITLKN